MRNPPSVGFTVLRETRPGRGQRGRRAEPRSLYPPELISAARELHRRGVPAATVIGFFCISRGTLWRWLAPLRDGA